MAQTSQGKFLFVIVVVLFPMMTKTMLEYSDYSLIHCKKLQRILPCFIVKFYSERLFPQFMLYKYETCSHKMRDKSQNFIWKL